MNGLEVPQDVGISQTEARQIAVIWDSYDAIHNWLCELGLDAAQRPNFPLPTLTEDDYVNIEGDDYSRTTLRIHRWSSYAKGIVSQLRGKMLAVTNEMKIISVDYRQGVRQQYAGTKTKKPSAEENKDNIDSIPRYRELMLYEQNLQMALWDVEATLYGLDLAGKGLSRQLTFRGQEIDLGHKAGRTAGSQRR